MFITFLLSSFVSLHLFAFDGPEAFLKDSSDNKVLIFLSKDCPCSKSHGDHLNQLAKDFKNIPFYGVITDRESLDSGVSAYYKTFGFSIISDPQHQLIKQFKALKTPHAVILKRQPNNQESILYEGGVSDQRDGTSANVYFLRENLTALQKNQPLPFSKGKSLGCYIRRL